MVGACQQNSGIFLVRGGGAGLAAGSERDADDQITGAGGGLGATCLQGLRLGWQRTDAG